jgi:hypothetical protein
VAQQRLARRQLLRRCAAGRQAGAAQQQAQQLQAGCGGGIPGHRTGGLQQGAGQLALH